MPRKSSVATADVADSIAVSPSGPVDILDAIMSGVVTPILDELESIAPSVESITAWSEADDQSSGPENLVEYKLTTLFKMSRKQTKNAWSVINRIRGKVLAPAEDGRVSIDVGALVASLKDDDIDLDLFAVMYRPCDKQGNVLPYNPDRIDEVRRAVEDRDFTNEEIAAVLYRFFISTGVSIPGAIRTLLGALMTPNAPRG
jgi:hypothetical protein